MSTFRVTNRTPWPVHSALSWAGIQQVCHSGQAPSSVYEYSVGGLGWHDFTVTIGKPFDPRNNNNILDIGKFILGAAAFVTPVGWVIRLAAAGAAAIWTAVEVVEKNLPQHGLDVRLASSVKDIRPVRASMLYGPDGYDLDISGGTITGHPDPDGVTYVITDIAPLSVNWRNHTSGSQGTVTATS